MHFSIYKKNITPIGFCLLLYFVTFRYKKCTEPTINIFYENMCHFTTAVCFQGLLEHEVEVHCSHSKILESIPCMYSVACAGFDA